MTSRKSLFSLTLLAILALMLAACTAVAAEPSADMVLQLQPADDAPAEAPLLQTDDGTGLSITFDEPDPDQPVDDGETLDDTAVAGSDGTLVNVEPSGDESVELAGGAGEDTSAQDFETALSETAVEWQPYSDATYGFELVIPSAYTVAVGDGAGLQPRPVQVLTFGAAQTAVGEPPEFEVRVYDNRQGQSLAQWLDANAIAAPQDLNAEVGMVNGREATEVCTDLLIAPRCVTYVAGSGVIYELRGTGAHTDPIIDSFLGG